MGSLPKAFEGRQASTTLRGSALCYDRRGADEAGVFANEPEVLADEIYGFSLLELFGVSVWVVELEIERPYKFLWADALDNFDYGAYLLLRAKWLYCV